MYARIVLFAALLSASTSALAVPRIHHWILKNGAQIYFVQSRMVPMLDINVTFNAGSARDPRGRSGLAMLTSSMVGQDAGPLDTDEIDRRLDDVGATLNESCGRDMAAVSLQTLADPKMRGPAIRMLALVLGHPTFPSADFARKVHEALLGLRFSGQSLGSVADKAWMALVYKNEPYGPDPGGTKTGIEAITRSDLEPFYRRYYVGSNAVVAIVGDASMATARHIASVVAGDLRRGVPAPPLPPVQPLRRAEFREIAYPSVQSQILIGQPGIARGDPDYFPLLVGNYILGGDPLESRLAVQIRQKRGLSYTSYSYFYPMQQRGPFVISVLTRNTERDTALRLARKVLTKFVAQGPTPAELVRAKKYLTGSFPLNIDSNGKLAGYLSMIGFYRLPLDYLSQVIPKIEGVTLPEINRAFKKHVYPDRMVTLVVGGRK